MGQMKLATDHVPGNFEAPGRAKPEAKQYPRWSNRCPHVLQVWTWGPHPRYGDRVPFCAPSIIAHPSCGCPR